MASEEAMWKKFYEKTQEDADNVENSRVIKSDDGFFEKFGKSLKKAAETKEDEKVEENRKRAEYQEASSEEDLPYLSEPTVQKNPDDLFCDVYYQCTHLVGQDANAGFKKDAIIKYLKEVFELDDAKFSSLADVAKSRQAPKMMLKVEVIEAKELTPKDANGLSDPFCVLYVSSSQTDRFTTTVKQQTLKPIWEESFTLPLSSATQDVLYFEVWDFDPAETVKDKLTKFSEVKGIWGVKKMMKELAQTISTGNHDNELIGCAQITLKNVPTSGQMAWFKLQKRSKSGYKGMILLKMMFGSEKDEHVALEEHQLLIRKLLFHQLKKEDFDITTWDGTYDRESELILRQHLAQSNLGATDDFLARWVEYVIFHQTKSLSFAVLASVLSSLLPSIKAGLLTDEELLAFWKTARKLLPYCFNSIRKIRKSEPGDKKVIAQLDAILNIIQDLSSLNIPSNIDLFPTEAYGWVATIENYNIKSVLHEAVIHGAYDWFEYLINHNVAENDSDEAILKNLVKITKLISLDLQGAIEYHEGIFKSRLNFPYAKTIYAVYQCNLADMIGPIVTDMCMMLKPLDFEKRNDSNADNESSLATGMNTFELFLTLQGIDKMGVNLFENDDVFETFQLRKYYSWFFTGVVRWLDIAAYKALQRVEKAVELDTFKPVDSTVLFSSSAIDTMAIFHQVKTFWDQLSWPDVEGSYTFIAKIMDDICKASVHYADQVALKVDSMGQTKTAYETKFEVVEEWCVAINNIDYIHHSIHPFVKELGLDKMLSCLADFKSTVTAEHCRQTLDLVMANAVENVGNKIAELLETLATKMEPSMTRFLQEGAELLHQQCNIIDRLMQYLDENLMTLNSKLNPDNFNRVLDVIWDKLSGILFSLVQNGIEKRRPPSYFSNLHETLQILIGFFKIDEKCSEEENTKLKSIISNVEHLLTIYGMETPQLIHRYYLQRVEEQDSLEKSEDGKMAITLGLENDKLNLEILNAQSIRAMDSNGLCDPFVSVRLLPKEKFGSSKYKTKVQKKTLFPLFEETFSIPFTEEHRAVKDGLIMFVMRDQDFYGAKNDYMAEGYVRISQAHDAQQGGYPKQIHINLSRPSNAENEILKALDYRQGDKMARDFVKKQKTRMGVPH